MTFNLIETLDDLSFLNQYSFNGCAAAYNLSCVPSLSNKGMSFLDDLLSGSDEVEPLVLSEEDAKVFVEAVKANNKTK